MTNIDITCSIETFTIGGTVSGLVGEGLVVQLNGGDDLAISANGDIIFATPLADLSDYEVTVLTQPNEPVQTCTVANATGKLAGSEIDNIEVICTTDQFTIGGEVSVLTGAGLVLQNNGGDDLTIAADGTFIFGTALDDLSTYEVTVFTQPIDPLQLCTVTNSAGKIDAPEGRAGEHSSATFCLLTRKLPLPARQALQLNALRLAKSYRVFGGVH